jgi:alpha-tubulin suppressor-like RCC1 family protein
MAQDDGRRVIVQLMNSADQLFALCNDGTVWIWEWASGEDDADWTMLKQIPQPQHRPGIPRDD